MHTIITKDFEISYLVCIEDGGKKGTNITFTIYRDAFLHNGKPCANKLFHVVGHEMVHACNRIHNYYDWDIKWRDAWDETLASKIQLLIIQSLTS